MADSLKVDLFFPRFTGSAGLRILGNLANYRDFLKFLIGRMLEGAALFYYGNFAPRFAERGTRRWTWVWKSGR
jgi:hypothetical protein